MTKRRMVSSTFRMQALALFTMANQNYRRADAFGKELSTLLGYKHSDAWNHLADAWLDENPDFDKAFAADGFTVRPAKTKARAARKVSG